MFQATVALPETYDALLADNLTRTLGLEWEWRQRVTLTTRQAKNTRSLNDYTGIWRERATATLGVDASGWAARAVRKATKHPHLRHADQVTAQDVEVLAAAALTAVESRRSTWSRWNIQAQVCREITSRGLQFASPADFLAVRDRITTATVDRSVLLGGGAIASEQTRALVRAHASAESAIPETFTSQTILTAEDDLLDAAADRAAPCAIALTRNPSYLDDPGHKGVVIDDAQRSIIASICASGGCATCWSGQLALGSPPRWRHCVERGKPITVLVR